MQAAATPCRIPDTPREAVDSPPTLRIGILTLDWPPISGGMSRFCVETCKALADRGHEILALTARRGRPIEYPRIKVIPELIGDLSIEKAILRQHDPEVDLWHAWEFGFTGLADAARQPLFVTVHGNDLYQPKVYHRFTHTPLLHRLARWTQRPFWQRRFCRRGIHRTTRFLPNSHATSRRLAAFVGGNPPSEVVPCGVADHFFQSHESHGAPPRFLTVCSLSRLRPRKNVAGVLQALASVKDRFEFHYYVCGDGDLRPELETLAADLDMKTRVTFHGQVSEDLLLAHYRRADLFILTPYEEPYDVEGFGIVYLEANAAGTPVLATRTGGVTDAVKEGVSGLFAASPAPDDLAAALNGWFREETRFDPHQVRSWANSHRYAALAERLECIYRADLPVAVPAVMPAARIAPETTTRNAVSPPTVSC